MVKYCVVYGCKQLQISGSGIQFHRFPFSRPAVLKKWVNAIRRDNWSPTGSSTICSKHFTENCYQLRPGIKVKLLKEEAVPSVFDFSTDLQAKVASKRQLEQFGTTVIQANNAREEVTIKVREEPLVVDDSNCAGKEVDSNVIKVEPPDTHPNLVPTEFVNKKNEETSKEGKEGEYLEPFQRVTLCNIKVEGKDSEAMECDSLTVDEYCVPEGEPHIKIAKVEQWGAIKVKEEPLHCNFKDQHNKTINVEPPDTDSRPAASEVVRQIKQETNKDDLEDGNLEPFHLINVDDIKTEVEDAEEAEHDPLAVDEDCFVKDGHQIKEEFSLSHSGGQPSTCQVPKLEACASRRSYEKPVLGKMLTLDQNSNNDILDEETSPFFSGDLPRQSWREEDMIQAVLAVRRKELTYRAAGKYFHVPITTMKCYITAANDYEQVLFNSILRTPSTLPRKLEEMLISYCYEMKHGSMRKAHSIFNKLKDKMKTHPEIIRNKPPRGELCNSNDLNIDCLLNNDLF